MKKKVKFFANCNNRNSKWSFSIGLLEVLRLWHNAECSGMTAEEAQSWRDNNYYAERDPVLHEIRLSQGVFVDSNHWNPRVPDHVQNGVINFPAGLNQDNEGSMGEFSIGLLHKLNPEVNNVIKDDVEAVMAIAMQAKQDAVNQVFWKPTREDIVNVS